MTPEPYRGIDFSVSDEGNGRWRWKLHPKIAPGTASQIIEGEVTGTQDDAILAARAAIDKRLGPSF